MARDTSLQMLCNPLVSSQQLIAFRQKYESHRIDAFLFKICLLTETAGVLLRLPQEVIATSIILLQRQLIVSAPTYIENDSAEATEHDDFSAESTTTRSAAAVLFLAAKQSFYPLSPRSIVNVFALLTSSASSPLQFINQSASDVQSQITPPDPKSYYVSEGTYHTRRAQLFATEKTILVSLGFDTKVALPYTLALTYLQALSASTTTLCERIIAHLNTALLSPQLLYLTHQPHALAVAAIYLSAREQGAALVDDEVPWWEVFDVGREELGFLVLSLGSMKEFVKSLGWS